jgi:hypothetical protein
MRKSQIEAALSLVRWEVPPDLADAWGAGDGTAEERAIAALAARLQGAASDAEARAAEYRRIPGMIAGLMATATQGAAERLAAAARAIEGA